MQQRQRKSERDRRLKLDLKKKKRKKGSFTRWTHTGRSIWWWWRLTRLYRIGHIKCSCGIRLFFLFSGNSRFFSFYSYNSTLLLRRHSGNWIKKTFYNDFPVYMRKTVWKLFQIITRTGSFDTKVSRNLQLLFLENLLFCYLIMISVIDLDHLRGEKGNIAIGKCIWNFLCHALRKNWWNLRWSRLSQQLWTIKLIFFP